MRVNGYGDGFFFVLMGSLLSINAKKNRPPNLLDRRYARRIRMQKFTERILEIEEEPTVFDEQLWGGLVEHMTVFTKDKVTFTFVGGIEVTVD